MSLFQDGKIDLNMVLDETGRNLVLLAMIRKQFDFIYSLGLDRKLLRDLFCDDEDSVVGSIASQSFSSYLKRKNQLFSKMYQRMGKQPTTSLWH